MKVLIAGGSGMIGMEISRQLLDKGHDVSWLTRQPSKNKLGVAEYAWNTRESSIELAAFEGVDTIINLAGAPISERWSASYKEEILQSRLESVRLLHQTVKDHQLPVKTFICASAVGYYPDDLEREFSEDDDAGNHFLSKVCKRWEAEAQSFESLNIRTLCCRIGIVLSMEGGALAKLVKPVQWGIGSPLGNGKQWMAWIHLKDLAAMFVFLAERQDLHGVFNTVGPYNITNRDLTRAVAKTLNKPLFMPAVPAFALKLALGEMSQIVLVSNKASSHKIREAGFEYQFDGLEAGLQDLLH